MVIKSSENSFAAWTFLIGVIIAVVIGLGTSSFLSISSLKQYSPPIYALLVILGLIIGFSVKVSGRDSQTFLITGTVLVIISRFGMDSTGGSLIGIGLGDTVSSVFGALLVLFIPATIIVALKTVFSLTRI